MNLFLVAGLGYLIGTISFSRILGRLLLPDTDLTETEYEVEGTEETWTYRGVSATSLLKRAGTKWFVLAVVLDALKAFLPTLAFRLDEDTAAMAVVAVAVIAGHVWPVWWGFVGGRGQACLLGALLAIDALAIPVAALGGAVIGLIGFTSVYLARNMGPILLIPWFGVTAGVAPELIFAIGVNVIYWYAVLPDIAEERRARAAQGIPERGYRDRLALAWKGFFRDD